MMVTHTVISLVKRMGDTRARGGKGVAVLASSPFSIRLPP